MDGEITALIAQLRTLESEIERRLSERGAAVSYSFNNRKIVFERGVLEEHRRLKAR